MRQATSRGLSSPVTAVATACSYWAFIFPGVRVQLRRWHRRAERIADSALHADALQSLHAKRGNVEGAAAFAVLAPRCRRAQIVRVLVAYQVMHDYLDTVSERPARDPLRNGRQLHQALTIALDPFATHTDYFAHHRGDDGGYLSALVDSCRQGLADLSSFGMVDGRAQRLAFLSAEAQSRIHAMQAEETVSKWALTHAPPDGWLDGWEIAAAACSTLAIHALIAVAARPPRVNEAAAIEACYFPWVNALSTLLDRLIDQDAQLLAHARRQAAGDEVTAVATERLRSLAQECARRCHTLREPERHRMLLAGMACYYLCAPTADATPVARRRILEPLGLSGRFSMTVFAAYQALSPSARSRH